MQASLVMDPVQVRQLLELAEHLVSPRQLAADNATGVALQAKQLDAARSTLRDGETVSVQA